MATLEETARSGKTETLTEVLNRIQHMRIKRACLPIPCYLMFEDWDWLVVLQCLQDHNLYKSNPKRPPFKEFVAWVNENNVPQLQTHIDVRSMSYAYTKIKGTRYPWTDVTWQEPVLRRWRMLYKQLSSRLESLSDNNL